MPAAFLGTRTNLLDGNFLVLHNYDSRISWRKECNPNLIALSDFIYHVYNSMNAVGLLIILLKDVKLMGQWFEQYNCYEYTMHAHKHVFLTMAFMRFLNVS